jgi:hypothetical protein
MAYNEKPRDKGNKELGVSVKPLVVDLDGTLIKTELLEL